RRYLFGSSYCNRGRTMSLLKKINDWAKKKWGQEQTIYEDKGATLKIVTTDNRRFEKYYPPKLEHWNGETPWSGRELAERAIKKRDPLYVTPNLSVERCNIVSYEIIDDNEAKELHGKW